MSTITAILRRLAALENRRAPSTDTGSLDDVRRQLALIRERREAQAGYRPCGVSVGMLIEACRAAKAAAER
jgi:hypothetical protein